MIEQKDDKHSRVHLSKLFTQDTNHSCCIHLKNCFAIVTIYHWHVVFTEKQICQMVVMIDSICQLLQVNRITERFCVFPAHTLALYFKCYIWTKRYQRGCCSLTFAQQTFDMSYICLPTIIIIEGKAHCRACDIIEWFDGYEKSVVISIFMEPLQQRDSAADMKTLNKGLWSAVWRSVLKHQ